MLTNFLRISGETFFKYSVPLLTALYAATNYEYNSNPKEIESKQDDFFESRLFKKQRLEVPENKSAELPDYINPVLKNRYNTNKDAVMMALTLYGEGRGESADYRTAVANVINNRAIKSRKSIEQIVTAPSKFSCYNPNDSNLNAIKNPDMKIFEECYAIAEDVLNGKAADPTNGSRNYCNVAKKAKRGKKAVKFPFWARGKTPVLKIRCNNGTIGYFYNNVN